MQLVFPRLPSPPYDFIAISLYLFNKYNINI